MKFPYLPSLTHLANILVTNILGFGVSDACVDDGDGFAGYGDDGDDGVFAVGNQALIEGRGTATRLPSAGSERQ
jgi:hypothetical protein